MAEIESPSRVSIRANFLRSINIREDLASTETISSYILTPELQELAETIVRSITDPRGSRAWVSPGPMVRASRLSACSSSTSCARRTRFTTEP